MTDDDVSARPKSDRRTCMTEIECHEGALGLMALVYAHMKRQGCTFVRRRDGADHVVSIIRPDGTVAVQARDADAAKADALEQMWSDAWSSTMPSCSYCCSR